MKKQTRFEIEKGLLHKERGKFPVNETLDFNKILTDINHYEEENHRPTVMSTYC